MYTGPESDDEVDGSRAGGSALVVGCATIHSIV